MGVQVIDCPKCGAGLDVVEGVEIIRCKFCGARSQVGSGGASTGLHLIAEMLDRVESHVGVAAREIGALRSQHAMGVASQLETDDAARRAAMAHENASREVAIAARLSSATTAAFIEAGAQAADEHQRQKDEVLALRESFRIWRQVKYQPLVVTFALLAGAVLCGLFGGDSWVSKAAPFLWLFFILFFLISPWSFFLGRYMSRRYARKYNERAFLFGLDEIKDAST